MTSKMSIVIPAYNEGQNIGAVLASLVGFATVYHARIIVVNDGSKDDTAIVLQTFKRQHPDLAFEVITHSVNRGYGAALKSGINRVTTEYLVTIDADGQHELNDIPVLYKKLTDEQADLCIGNRNFKGSSLSRNFIKRLVLFFVKKATGIGINDLNSGMKMYKTSIVKKLIRYAPNGMPFSDVIVLLHHQFRYKIVEEDIHIKDRINGVSTINYKTAIQTIVEVAHIIINFFPFKFFCYIAIVLFLSGTIWGIPFILDGRGLSTGTSFLLLSSINFLFFGIVLESVVRSRFESYSYEETGLVFPSKGNSVPASPPIPTLEADRYR